MNSVQAFLDLQIKVSDLESRLNLLVKWISHKFEDDSTLPAKLISGSGSSSLVEPELGTGFENGHYSSVAGSSRFTNYGSYSQPVILATVNSANASRLRRRKQHFTNVQAASATTCTPYDLIPITVKEEEDIEDHTEKIRVVDMASIINPPEDALRQEPLSSRTRQPYACTTCNRKFRTQSVLDRHKMTHCFVQITASDIIRVQPFLSDEGQHPEPDNMEVGDPSLSESDANDDIDFQPIDVDSDASVYHEAKTRTIAGTIAQKTRAPPNVGDFVCTICQKRYSKHRYMLDHMRVQHYEEYITIVKPRNPPLLPITDDFMCTLCILPKKFANAKYLRDHKRVRHEEEYQKEFTQRAKRNMGDFACTVCPKRFARDRYRNDHMRKYHPDAYKDLIKQKPFKPSQKKIVTFRCSTCQESFDTNLLLKQHRITNHPAEYKIELDAINAARRQRHNFKCKLCNNGIIYRKEHLLRNHKAEVHGMSRPKPFKCNECECGARFFSIGNLKHHQLSVHQKSRPCLCPICGKGYPRKYDLQVHMDIHSEEKKYQCSLCEKSFRQRVGLMIHEKRHSKSTTQCVQCGQFYVNLAVLRKHERTVHAGIRAFPCTKCDKSFKEKLHLSYHLKTHDNPHGRKRGLNKERDIIVPKKRPTVNRLKVFPTKEDEDCVETVENFSSNEITRNADAVEVPRPEVLDATASEPDQINFSEVQTVKVDFDNVPAFENWVLENC